MAPSSLDRPLRAFSRRAFLGAFPALAFAPAPPAIAAAGRAVPEGGRRDPADTNLSAVVRLADGTEHHFRSAAGVEKSPWTNPYSGAVQRCISVRESAFPFFSVEFRPEADGSRDEVLFSWGDVKQFGNPASCQPLAPYTVRIFRG